MSKFKTLGTVKIDKDRIGPNEVIELDDDAAAALVKGTFLAPAPSDAAITAPPKAAAAHKKAVAEAEAAAKKAKDS